MIELKNIKKTFNKDGVITEALKGVNLTIEDGEMVAVMGSSGSGKSTLLNVLGALIDVTDGVYKYNDIEVNKLKVKELAEFRKKSISYVFQEFMLMDDYTAYENIEVPLRLKEVSKKTRKELVNSVMKRVGITDIGKKRPKHLSGGQKQRVAIARAIVSNTDVILADEPTGALDSENSKSIMELFQKVHEMKKTVIIVTHDKEVAEYCDRIICMKDGVIEDGRSMD